MGRGRGIAVLLIAFGALVMTCGFGLAQKSIKARFCGIGSIGLFAFQLLKMAADGKPRFVAIRIESGQPRAGQALQAVPVAMNAAVGWWLGGQFGDDIECRISVVAEFIGIPAAQICQVSGQCLPISLGLAWRLELFIISAEKSLLFRG